MSEEVLTPPWDRFEDPEHVCSFPDCGRTGEDEGWPTLIYITVVTCPDEEGYAEVTQALCQEHFEQVVNGLRALGFKSHNHHGTNQLDAEDECGGYDRCPTPADYGPELVQPPGSFINAPRRCPHCSREDCPPGDYWTRPQSERRDWHLACYLAVVAAGETLGRPGETTERLRQVVLEGGPAS